MIFFIGLFIVLNEFSISNINIQIIDQILTEYKNISILFTLICLMISVNGFNFIDGNHGLMLGTSLIILINFLLNINLIESTEIIVLIESLLIASIILFLFNFITGRIIAGDAGSYFVGILIGSIAIYLKNNDLLSSFHIACILFYPTTEVIITFIRRLFILKTNPFFPDSLHLHSLIYSLLVRNIINLGPEFKNRLCSMIILSLQIMATLFLFLYGSKIGFNFTYFIFVTVYIIIYTIFLYLEFKNKINY
jgi:UDP-N-acetylmuramyl pentapeptide phosphotransferase/UDP-N-acetylglucosamine-1-phosphate transferase